MAAAAGAIAIPSFALLVPARSARLRAAEGAARAGAEAAAEADADADADADAQGRRRLVIALPAAPAAVPPAGHEAAPRDGDLFRRLFSANQRRVASASASTPASAPAPAEAAPVLALRRAAMASASGEEARYGAVPVEDFGAAMLRGMGVSEEALAEAAAPEPAADAADAAAPPLPQAGSRKREREHRGLGAAANPLALLGAGAGAGAASIRRADVPARARATARAVNPSGLVERRAARLLSAVACASSSSTLTPLSAAAQHVGALVMVWQLEGVPGLQKILVRALPVAVGEEPGPGLLTLAVGLREAQPVETALLQGAAGEGGDAAAWAEITRRVEAEEAAARVAKSAADAAAAAALAVRRGAPPALPIADPGSPPDPTAGSTATSTAASAPAPAVFTSEALAVPTPAFAVSATSPAPALLAAPSSAPAAPSTAAAPAPAPAPAPNWLRTGISVRVVDESWRGGRFFRRRGVVQDVLAPGVAQLRLPAQAQAQGGGTGELLEGVPQACLETALPKAGGTVLVVRGVHRGSVCELLERDARKQRAALRRRDDGVLLQGVAFDDVAEYAEVQ